MNDEKIVTLRYTNETGDELELVEIDVPAAELDRGEIAIRTYEPRRFKGEEALARIQAWHDEIRGGGSGEGGFEW